MAEQIYHGDTLLSSPVTLGASTTVRYGTRISVDGTQIKLQRIDQYLGFKTSDCTITLYLFTDNSGEPGTQIDQLATKTFTSADTIGWYTIYNVSSGGEVLDNNTDYWIVTKVSGSNGIETDYFSDNPIVSDSSYVSNYTRGSVYATLTGSWTVVAAATDFHPPFRYWGLVHVNRKATNPTPADEAQSVETSPTVLLDWESGDTEFPADSSIVYIGGGLWFDDGTATTDTFLDYSDKLYGPSTTWRVDSIYGSETVTGDEWEFYPELIRGATWILPYNPTPYIDQSISDYNAVEFLWKGDFRSVEYELWAAVNGATATLIDSPAERYKLVYGLVPDDTVIWYVKEKLKVSLVTEVSFWVDGPSWTFTIRTENEINALSNRPLGGMLKVWLSKSGQYNNFDEGVKDADSFSLVIPTTNESIWLKSLDSLLLGTAGGEWRIGSNRLDTSLTPTNFSVKEHTTYGSKQVQAMAVNSSILYVDFVGRKIREMTYVAGEEKYVSPDLTELAEHITKSGIVDMAHQKNPNSIVWVVLADGSLLSMVYDRQQDVVAWSDHPTDGLVQSVCVVPGTDEDAVWISVTRTINSVDVVYIEKMMPRDFGSDRADAFCVDSGITDISGSTTISGLDHLEGEAVVVLGDGAEQTEGTTGDFTVGSGAKGVGEIIVPSGLSTVQAGLSYNYKLQPMRLVTSDQGGTSFGSITRVNDLVVSFLNTLGAKYGDSDSALFPIDFTRNELEDEQNITGLFSGDVPCTLVGGYSVQNPIIISGSGPEPCTVRAIICKFEKTGR